MAYRAGSATSQAASGSTFVPTMPSEAQQTGDMLILVALNDSGSIATSIPSWTEILPPTPRNSSRCSIWYIEHTGTTITAPTISGTNNDWIVFVEIIRDADTADFINQAARTDISTPANIYSAPAVTTDEDDCLFYQVIGQDVGDVVSPSYGYGITEAAIEERIGNISLYVNAGTKGAAGLISSRDYNNGSAATARAGTAYTVAFNNKSGGLLEPSIDAVPTMIENYSEFPTVAQLSAIRTTLLGISTAAYTINSTTRQTAYSLDLSWHGGYTQYSLTNTSSLTVQGLYKDITSTDMSVYPYSITVAAPSTFLYSDDGILFYFEDGGGNWVLWQPLTKEQFGNFVFHTLIAVMPDQTFIDSSGTMDWTDIVRTGFAEELVSTSTGARIFSLSCECVMTPATMIGGSTTKPCNSELLFNTFETGLSIYRTRTNGEGQVLACAGINIGDGVTPTHFIGQADSLAYPEDGSDILVGYFVGDGGQGYIVDTSANCVMDFRSWVTRSTNLQTFTVDAGADITASFLTTGWILKGFSLTWKTGIACPDANFIECGILDIKGASFLGGTVVDSVSTTHAMTATDGAAISYSFTKGAETYAIELPSVGGAYDLSDATFSGYTTELNVTAASGTTTITLAAGQAEPSYATAGATVTFLGPLVNSSVTSIVSGSRLRVYNDTTAAEIYNDVPGTSYSVNYNDGSTYSSGDVVTIYLTQTSGVTAQAEFQQSVVVTSNGWSILAAQVSDDVYDTLGIDGSSIAKFAADYVNDEVDLVVAGNFTGAEFYAWWLYNLTTSQGISDFFGGVTAVDQANFRTNTAVVDMYWNNNTATNVHQTDNRRLYRDDGVYPVLNPTTGGGGIDLVWKNTILIASTGGSALTPAEQTQLTNIDSRTADTFTRFDLDSSAENTYNDNNEVIANSRFTLTNTDNGNGTFTVKRT